MEGKGGIHERTFVLVSGSTSHMRDIAVNYIECVKMGGERRGGHADWRSKGFTRRRSGPGARGRTLISESYVEFGALPPFSDCSTLIL
jgi:hypothetical protein